jgi:PAS domain S-box-containing protein
MSVEPTTPPAPDGSDPTAALGVAGPEVFRIVAEAVPQLVWTAGDDGVVTYYNGRSSDYAGIERREDGSWAWAPAVHPDDAELTGQRWADAVAHRGDYECEHRVRMADGSYRWHISRAVPVTLGGRTTWFGTATDTHRLKEAELAVRRAHDEERRVALRLQEALLPGRPLDHRAVEIATHYSPGSRSLEVGGDWYESFLLADGRIGIAVGDVCGHNIEAAAAMGQLRAGLLALATRAGEPGRLLADLDHFAVGHDICGFATACCAFLDPTTGMLSHASAGHLPLLVAPPGGPPRWLEGGRSAPLGCLPLAEAPGDRPGDVVQLVPGTVVVAFTDGLVERRGEVLDVGLARVHDVVASSGDRPVAELCRRLVGGLAAADPEDDVAVLCLRWSGPADG